jgi:heat shock protein 1/8
MSGDELIPIGIDLGSLHARVAIGNVSHHNVPSTGNKDTDTRPLPNVISNAQGSRYTLALVGSDKMSGEEDNDSEVRHIFGEAARRALAREKKPTISKDPSSMVRELVKSSSSVDGGDDNKSSAAAAFFGHLADLACDASSAHPSKLRAVVSVNVGASPEEQAGVVETIEAGVREALKSRTDAKQKKKEVEPIVVGVITDPAAVCIAHGLTEVENSDAIDLAASNPDTWKNALVVDWGASGLTATHVRRASPNSSLLTIVKHATDTSCSGTAIVNTLVSHCASMFERKNKVSGVLDSVKAHHRLELACESAVRALSRAPTTAVSIDGLYEGIDLNVPISRPRFDMMASAMLRKAEALLQSFSEGTDNFDVVLLAGNVCDMPSATNLIRTKLFPDASAGRGDIPADEAVAIGCARHSASVLSCQTHSRSGGKSTDKAAGVTTRKVKACPINIGIAKSGDEENALPLIEVGQALPANTTRNFTRNSGEDIVIVQMNGGAAKSSKVLGKIEKLPADKSFEITMELSQAGKLSLSINGGPTSTL